jgi:hypothetical protein
MKLFGRPGGGTPSALGRHLIERLIDENGWRVDLRHGHGFAVAFEGDATTPTRDVHIVHTPGNALVLFFCSCRVRCLARSMSPVTLAMLLARNKTALFARWQITVEDGEVAMEVYYPALAAGLTPPLFKAICSSLLSEVAFVEEALLGGAHADDVPDSPTEPV